MEMKTTGLGFAAACGIQVGGVVIVGGVLRRVMEVDNRKEGKPAPVHYVESVPSNAAPYFLLTGDGWWSWQQCAVYAGRSVKELAQEAIDIQNACNPLGLSKGYAKALQELRWALEVEGKENDTDAIRLHAINRLWLDKLCDLARYDGDRDFGKAYNTCQQLSGIIACTNEGAGGLYSVVPPTTSHTVVEHLTEEQTKERMSRLTDEEKERMVYGFVSTEELDRLKTNALRVCMEVTTVYQSYLDRQDYSHLPDHPGFREVMNKVLAIGEHDMGGER